MRTQKQGSLSQNLEFDTYDRASGQELRGEKERSRSQIHIFTHIQIHIHMCIYTYI